MKKKALVTGGAGFIGSNLVVRLINEGWQVSILDNLSRRGSEYNLAWLREQFPRRQLRFKAGDVRDFEMVKQAVNKNELVFHLAAQVAVTSSFMNPREDFEVNALGSFNVLEAAREADHKPIVVFASTNKVYGSMAHLRIKEGKKRYYLQGRPYGIDESQPLDFHSPYGCSNGVADQYTRDFYRMYGLPTVVFRQSCIYGPRQLGVEEQGWVAYLAKAFLKGWPITLYGTGKQVRDLLYVDDLIEAYMKAVKKIDKVKGEVYNIGGGRQNAMSVLEVIGLLGELSGKKTKLKRAKARPGDQKVFISDNRKVEKVLDWQQEYKIKRGVKLLFDWVKEWIKDEES